MEHALLMLDAACTKLYSSQLQAERADAERSLCLIFAADAGKDAAGPPAPTPERFDVSALCTGVATITRHMFILARSSCEYSQLFAASSLVATVERDWVKLKPDDRLGLSSGLLELLQSGGARFKPAVVTSMVTCVARVTALAYRDDDRHQATVGLALSLVETNPPARALGLRLLVDVITEVQRPASNIAEPPGLRQFMFRDRALRNIASGMLALVHAQMPLKVAAPDLPELPPVLGPWVCLLGQAACGPVARVVNGSLAVLLAAYGFKFGGTNLPDNDLAPVELPQAWVATCDVAALGGFCRLLAACLHVLSVVWGAAPHSSSVTWLNEAVQVVLPPPADVMDAVHTVALSVLEVLEMLVAVRRHIFSEHARRVRVSFILAALTSVLQEVTAMVDAGPAGPSTIAHHLARVVGRFFLAHHITDVAMRPEFAGWTAALADFTMQTFRTGNSGGLYLLQLWAQLVSATMNLHSDHSQPVGVHISNVLQAFVKSRLDMCATPAVDPGHDGDEVLGNQAAAQVYAQAVASLARSQLGDTCQFLATSMGTLLQQLTDTPNAPPAVAVGQRQLAWLLHFAAALLRHADPSKYNHTAAAAAPSHSRRWPNRSNSAMLGVGLGLSSRSLRNQGHLSPVVEDDAWPDMPPDLIPLPEAYARKPSKPSPLSAPRSLVHDHGTPSSTPASSPASRHLALRSDSTSPVSAPPPPPSSPVALMGSRSPPVPALPPKLHTCESIARLCLRCLQVLLLVRGDGSGMPGSAKDPVFSDVDDVSNQLLQSLSLTDMASRAAAPGGLADRTSTSADTAWTPARVDLELALLTFASTFVRLYTEEREFAWEASLRRQTASFLATTAGAGAASPSSSLPPSGRLSDDAARRVTSILLSRLGLHQPFELLDAILAKLLDNMRLTVTDAVVRLQESTLRTLHELAVGATTSVNTLQEYHVPACLRRGNELLRTVCIKTMLRRPVQEVFPALAHGPRFHLRSVLYGTLARFVFLNARALARPPVLMPPDAGGAIADDDDDRLSTASPTTSAVWDAANDSWFQQFVAPLEAGAVALAGTLCGAGGHPPSGAPGAAAAQAAVLPTVGWLRDVRGIVSAASTANEFNVVFEWVQPHLAVLPAIARKYVANTKVVVPLLRVASELSHNRVARIKFSSADAGGITLFKSVADVITTVSTHLLLAFDGPHAAAAFDDDAVMKCAALCCVTAGRLFTGGYTNFGIMELYGDTAAAQLWGTTLQLLLTIRVVDLRTRRKVAAAVFGCTAALVAHNASGLLTLPPPALVQLLERITVGIRLEAAVDGGTVSWHACVAVEALLEKLNAALSAARAATRCAVPNATQLAALSPASPTARDHLAVAVAHVSLVAAAPHAWRDLVITVLQALLYDPVVPSWALPRAVLLVCVVFPDGIQACLPELLKVTPEDDRTLLAAQFQALLRDVPTVLSHSTKDTFTKAAYRFRRAMSTRTAAV